jgi:hypothetical protein
MWNDFRVSTDGVLVRDNSASQDGGPDGALLHGNDALRDFVATAMCVRVWPTLCSVAGEKGSFDRICVYALGWAPGHLSVMIGLQARRITIDVIPCSDEDLKVVALLQAMLSQGLAQMICEAGRHAVVSVHPCPGRGVFTQAGLNAQILPLFPFAAPYKPRRDEGLSGGSQKERMGIKQEGPVADEGSATWLDEGGSLYSAPHAAVQPGVWEGCLRPLLLGCKWMLAQLRRGIKT